MVMMKWVEQYTVPDQEFNFAYESIDDKKKGIIKKNIAQLFDIYLNKTTFTHYLRDFKQGFNISFNLFPPEWGVILIPHWFAACSQILSAVVVAIMSEVKDLYFIRIEKKPSKFDPLLLVGLEFSGCNTVLNLSWTKAKELITQLIATAQRGFLITLGDLSFINEVKENTKDLDFHNTFFLVSPKRAILFPEAGFKKEIITLFNPHIDIKVIDNINNLDAYFPFDVAYVEESVIQKVATYYHVYVFGPGQEGFWVWKDIDPLILKEKSISVFRN